MHQQQGCMRHDAMRKEEIRTLHEIGAITVGQSPRVDVMPDLEPLLSGIRVIQKGALDGMTREEMKKIEPEPGDYVLVSRLQDGSSVRMSEKFILPIIQQYIDAFNRQGVEGILMLCTGEFPHFTSHIPLLYPQKLLKAVTMAVLEEHQTLGILTPDSSHQIHLRSSRPGNDGWDMVLPGYALKQRLLIYQNRMSFKPDCV